MEYLNKKVLLRFVIGVVMVSLIFVGCKASNSSQKMKRYASVTGLKEEKIEEYKKLHAAAWPSVLKMIKECNIQNYSIYLKKIDGKNYLFSYFEYVGDNFELDMKKMGDHPETQRWWKETDPCQIPLPDAAAKGATWSDMEEVFHTD
ncbi:MULTISPECIES: L-rhamnose mutarotase [unclassified Sphingobacterium]|uniref:L-rhamnose mutarotase n=1 Tax=unclassified Sphingobacterium TaxID=2609468 RepID=UPI0010D9DF40|nr:MULTISPECIES: L-rhamnose mutarotase [unclassified Sphingobacterium]MCS3554243.1 L-rhamnose mutarotase [Sphingobacterium sp. JUb21]TCR08076.1 L-rhamnose mutarotase [Sphingobacterium sp. JUb20]